MPQEAPKKSSFAFLMWIVVFAICAAGLAIPFMMFVEAPPPHRLVIASGGKEGAYHRFAERYAELLLKEGITLDVRTTKGSVENLKLLQDESSDVSVALVQSGIADPQRSDGLQALGSLYWEPLWIFYRGSEPIDRLTQLAGRRVAVGPEGSGTRSIAMQLLSANGVDGSKAEFVDVTGNLAAEALLNGKVDAAFFVAGVDTGYIQQLLRAPAVKIVELSQAKAYERRFRFLSTLTIPAGGLLGLQDDTPAKDITVLAPSATLVSRKSLHPALISLLLDAATKVHSGGDLLTTPGEFPSGLHTDLPLSEHAKNYYRFGPPVLQRLMPFWLASLVDRMKIMIIPLVMLLMPLIRAAPPLVRWRTRRKIYRWYSRLRQIDQRSIQGMSVAEAKTSLEDLNELEQQLALVGIPLSYMEEYYNLRVHLDLVRSRVLALLLQTRTAPA